MDAYVTLHLPDLCKPITTCTASTLFTLVAPSAPPGAVQLHPQSAYSISVNWTLPPLVDRNGPITGYALRYRQADEEPETSKEMTIGLVQMHLLESLQPYTDYSVQVAAVNVNGTGPFSTFQETKTFSASKSAPYLLKAHVTYVYGPAQSPQWGVSLYCSHHICQSYTTALFACYFILLQFLVLR